MKEIKLSISSFIITFVLFSVGCFGSEYQLYEGQKLSKKNICSLSDEDYTIIKIDERVIDLNDDIHHREAIRIWRMLPGTHTIYFSGRSLNKFGDMITTSGTWSITADFEANKRYRLMSKKGRGKTETYNSYNVLSGWKKTRVFSGELIPVLKYTGWGPFDKEHEVPNQILNQTDNMEPITTQKNNQQIAEEYAKHFQFTMKLGEGWQKIKLGNTELPKYVYKQEPIKDGKNVGLVVSVDLLVESLGQKGLNVEEYSKVFFHNLSKAGFYVDNIKNYDGLSLEENWASFIMENKLFDRYQIILIRKISDKYILINQVIIVGGMQWLDKYKASIEDIINNSKFELMDNSPDI